MGVMIIRFGQVNCNNLNTRIFPSTSAPRWNSLWPQNHIALITSYSPGWYQTLYRGGRHSCRLPFSTRLIRKLFFHHMYISTVPKDSTTRQHAYKTVAGGVVTEYTQSRKKDRPPEDENGRDALLLRCAGQARDGAVQRDGLLLRV